MCGHISLQATKYLDVSRDSNPGTDSIDSMRCSATKN